MQVAVVWIEKIFLFERKDAQSTSTMKLNLQIDICDEIDIESYLWNPIYKELSKISKAIEYSRPLFEKLFESFEKENKNINSKVTVESSRTSSYQSEGDSFSRKDV